MRPDDFTPERIAELAEPYHAAIREIAATFAADVQPLIRAFRRLSLQMAMTEYRLYGRTRPNGRPRRTGHRHRGMPAWSRRHSFRGTP